MAEEIEDLKIINWLRDSTVTEDVAYQEILVFADKREKETHEYYINFLDRFGENGAHWLALFTFLCQVYLEPTKKLPQPQEIL